LALVAAVTALIVSGVWWLQRPSAEPARPAEKVPVPTVAQSSTTVVEDPANAWARFVDSADPAEVQLCLTRVSSNLAAMGDLPNLAAAPDLIGDSRGVEELRLQRSDISVVAALAGAPALDAATRTRLGEVAEAYAAADTAQFADEGRAAAEFADLVAAFEVLRNDVLAADPVGCPLEGVAAALLDVATDDIETARCLAAARLDHAIVTFPEADAESSLVGPNATALSLWYQEQPDDLVDLVARVRDAILLPSDLVADELSALRGEIERFAGDDCRLLIGGQPVQEETP
jgi:hypothetical protein